MSRLRVAAALVAASTSSWACTAQKAQAPDRHRQESLAQGSTAPTRPAVAPVSSRSPSGCTGPTCAPDAVYVALFDVPCEHTAQVGIVNARCAGAKGDGTTDDSDALNQAISMAHGRRGLLLVPPGDYLMTRKLLLPGRRSVIGAPEAIGKTRILFAESISPPLPAAVVSIGLNSMRNLAIEVNFRAKLGLHLFKSHGILSEFRNIQVRHALGDGVLCDYSMAGAMYEITAERNSGHGFRFNSCNSELVSNLRALSNGGSGVVISSAPSSLGHSASGGVHLVGGAVRGNAGPGLKILGTTSFSVVEDLEIETASDGIVVADGARLFALRQNRIRRAKLASASRSRAIRITNGSFNGFVLENEIASSKAAPGFASIELERGVTDTYVIGNRTANRAAFAPVPVIYQSRNFVGMVAHDEFLPARPSPGTATLPPTLSFAARPPIEPGQGAVGDVVINPRPAPGQDIAWICAAIDANGCAWRAVGQGDR